MIEDINTTGLEVAVIGMAVHFPDAEDVDQFWTNLERGVHSVRFFTDAQLLEKGVPPELLDQPDFVKTNGAVLEGKDLFDAAFFGYIPDEAREMDPQIRVFHEVVWHALENAAYDPYTYQGLIGLYAGASAHFYWEALTSVGGAETSASRLGANFIADKDFLATRISHNLNLRGPSINVQTACSTALVAIHLACQALLSGECHMALAGGVAISSLATAGYVYQKGMINSPDGYCRAFDASSNGTISGEGAGVVVLKPLEEALAERDHIHAVIKGSALNNDGKSKVGYSAPSTAGQAGVIRSAYKAAGVDPATISFIEAHGTGTRLGDPIEIEALNVAFGPLEKGTFAIGSVKTNIGHLDAAAGIAGFVKTVLALKHRTLPPSLHYETPNPNIDFTNSSFYVAAQSMTLDGGGKALRAGVSSFGIGGTNAHVVVEEAPAVKRQSAVAGVPQLIVLSARTQQVLDIKTRELLEYLQNHQEADLGDLAFTLQVGRAALNARRYWITVSIEELILKLMDEATTSGEQIGSEAPITDPEEVTKVLESQRPATTAGDAPWRAWLNKIGGMWSHGAAIDWRKVHGDEIRYRLPLPGYPFQRQDFSIPGSRHRLLLEGGVPSSQRETAPQRRANIDDWLYAGNWKQAPLTAPAGTMAPEGAVYLVFAESLGFGRRILEELKARGAVAVSVRAGAGFSKEGADNYVIEPSRPDSYGALMRDLDEAGRLPQRVIHCWSMDECDTAVGLESLLYVARELANYGATKPVKLMAVTNQAQEVTGEEELDPRQAVALGAVRVISQEYLHIDCMSLDIRLAEADTQLPFNWAAGCLAELEISGAATYAAYRGRHRWLHGYDPLVPLRLESAGTRLRVRGVYIVTGGLGYVGMRITKYLAEKTGGTLILTGRSPLGGEASQKMKELTAKGIDARYASVDVADETGMRRVVEEALEAHGAIHGVVYAAGIPGGQLFKGIKDIDSNDVAVQFQAKVIGPQVLAKVLNGVQLDFCLLSSSIATVLGALGNSVYTSANCFIDAFCAWKNSIAQRPLWTSVDWDHWNEMDDAEVSGLLDRIFALPVQNRLVVSPLDLDARMRQWDKQAVTEEPEPSVDLQPRPELSSRYNAPETDIEKRLAEIWSQFFGIAGIGVDDEFFELGGDSLKAMTVLLKINRCFDVDIPLSELFTFSTIRGLAGFIETADKEESQSIPPAEKREYYPLSSAQKRMFLLQELMPDTIAYNQVAAVGIGGDFSPQRFQEALRAIIQRHEIFRTSFLMVDGQPVQKILPAVDFSVRTLPGDAPLESVVRQFVQPFDLSAPPHMRAGLIPREDSGYVVVLDIHHVISDGVSKAVFIDELMLLLDGIALPSLSLHYKDYAVWQQQGRGKREIQKQEQYWLNRFSGDIPVIQLPLDHPRPVVQDYSGKAVEFFIGAEDTESLKQMGRRHGLTLFMMLLGSYSIFLSKLSRQQDIIVGTPTTGRGKLDFAEIIGIFINTLCVRTIVRPDSRIIDYLNDVKTTVLQAFENQDYQFEDLVEQLSVNRDTGRNPLFDIMFVFHNIEGPVSLKQHRGSEGLKSSPLDLETSVSKFDLTLEGEERDNGISLKLEYSTALFDQSTIQRFIDYFRRTVSAVAGQPEAPVSSIQLLDDEDKRRVLGEFNATDGDWPVGSTLLDFYFRRLKKAPGLEAVVDEEGPLTSMEFHRMVCGLAAQLASRGFAPGMICAIRATRSVKLLAGIYAILAAGGAYMPVDPHIPAERLRFVMKDSACGYLLTDNSDGLDLPSIETIDLSGGNAPEILPDQPPAAIKSSDSAYVIYTSGSTGIPKGVVVEHRSAVNLLAHLEELYPLRAEDTFLLKTNVTFDVSVSELFGWIFGDGRLAILPPGAEKDMDLLLDNIHSFGVTHINFVPSQLAVFIDALREAWTPDRFNLDYIFACGEAFFTAVAQTLLEWDPPFRVENIYGPTEATVYDTVFSISDFAGNHWVPIGKPYKNIHCYILDSNGKPLPVLVPGELYLGGECLARGYLNRPQLTSERFVVPAPGSGIDDPLLYKTGDIARWLADGNIQFLGRVDHQVKVRGFRIELGEIENRMGRHALVREAVVLTRKDGTGDIFLCGFYTAASPEGEKELSQENLLEFLSETLPDYMLPAHLIQLPEFQRNAAGKLDRRALENIQLPTHAASGKPKSALEEHLLSLWAEVLGVQPQSLGRRTNFFQAGGHSLKMTQLLSRVAKELDIKLSMMDAFHNPTVEGMAKLVQNQGFSGEKAIFPVKPRDYYPLSPSQRRLYVLQQMDPASIGYHMPDMIPLPLDADLERIESAFGRLIRRHESLRTSFHILNGKPVQRVHSEVAFHLERLRLEEGTPIDGGLIKELIRPFDLAEPPLLRGTSIQTSQELVLLLDIHHIVADGMSYETLVRDFTAFYDGREPEPRRLQYRDYCVWLQDQISGGGLEPHREFWLSQFSGDVPVLSLPMDFPRPAVQSFEGRTKGFELDGNMSAALHDVARRHDATLFMMLLALFSLLLSRLAGQDDVVVGTPVGGRNTTELEDVIGVFINMLPLRCRLDGRLSFADYLERIRRLSLEAFDHQMYPFDLLVDQLDLQRDTSRNPVFDAALMVQNYFRRRNDGDNGSRRVEHGTSKFDITLCVEEGESGLSLEFEYCTKLFKDSTIDRYIDYFKELTASVCRHPRALLAEISILPDHERRLVLETFNQSAGEYPRDAGVFSLFQQMALRSPQDVALVFEDQWFTYGSLLELALDIGAALGRAGFRDGDIAAVMLPRRVELLVALLGVMAAGGTYLYLDPDYPEQRKRFMLEDSAAGVAICAGEDETDFPPSCRKLALEDALQRREPGVWRAADPAPESLAYISYTSGSTGKPKGVMISHRSVVNFIHAILAHIPVGPEDRVFSLTTASFDIFVLETWLPLACGARVVLGSRTEQLDIPLAARTLANRDITVLQLTPSRLQLWASNPEAAPALNHVKYLVAGGEEFPQQLAEQVVQLTAAKTYNVYGPTETTVWSTICPVIPDRILTIGTPLLNNRVYILNRDGLPQPVGVAGELSIAGDGLARGYVNRPELTAERFVKSISIAGETFYRTGDLARWNPDGTIEFLGRIDNQVKLRGFRIELGEIQSRLTAHPGIREAVVLLKETKGGPAIGAYLVAEREFSVAQLRQYLASSLPDYMIPSFFTTLEHIPLTPNGKVDIRRLRAIEGRVATGVDFVAPNPGMEQEIAAIWKEVLGIEKIGSHDNFFELGGNSMGLLLVSEKLAGLLGRQVPVVSLYRFMTVHSLATSLAGDAAGEAMRAQGVRDRKTEIDKGKARLKNRIKRKKR
jgi:amino acid adenylation domain-containing protein